jgi:proteasome lid subunit RPN8/RPN11
VIQFLDEISDHFDTCYPAEACGLLYIVKGKLRWKACTNISEDGNSFAFDRTEYLSICKLGDIVGIVHSHPDQEEVAASEADIVNCNISEIPYIIFGYPSMSMLELKPEHITRGLMGLEYEFGVNDCLEAGRRYYDQVLDIKLRAREPYLDDWWDLGEDYFTEQHIKDWGFVKKEQLEINDILIFNVGHSIGTHCGVYLGNDIMYHHAGNRLSCRENIYPMWAKHLIGIYRYES